MIPTFARLEPPPPLLLPPVASGAPQLDIIHHCKAEDLLAALPDGSIDLVVTSPPYDNLRLYNGFTWDFERIARETYRVLKPGGVLVWVVGDTFTKGSETLTSFAQALHFKNAVGFNMHQRLIWQKNAIPHLRPKAYLPDFEDMFVFSKGTPATFNGQTKRNKNAGQTHKKIVGTSIGYKILAETYTIRDESLLGNVWEIRPGANGGDITGHPAPFPEELARRHIETWSNPGEIVLDFFSGGGTTAKMARNTNRHYIGCDISIEYVQMSQQRVQTAFTPPIPLFTSPPLAAAAPDGPNSRAAEQLRLELA
jgi:DNA modification methylase